VCRSVGHDCEPCESGQTNHDAIRRVDLGGPKEPCIRWGFRSPMQRGNFEGDEVVCSGPVVGIFLHTVDLPATKQLSGPLNFLSEKSPLLCHLPSEFFAHLLSFIMAALFSAVTDWMSTILPRMMWP